MPTRQEVEAAFAAAQRTLFDYIDDFAKSTKPPVVVDPPTPPPPPPPVGGGPINIMVRGQSNSLLFCDWGGVWRMRDDLKAKTGREVNIHYTWTDPNNNNTINSGSTFLTWDTDGKEQGLLNFVKAIPADKRAAPFITLWMHNESDQKDFQGTINTAWWVDEVRKDAQQVRAILGLSPSESPYLFVPVRYNYGNIAPIRAGMDQLVADASFAAKLSDAAWDAVMDGDGSPNSSHMGRADSINIGAKLATFIADWMKGSVTPPSPTGVLRFIDFPPWNVQQATLHVDNTTGQSAQWVVFDDNAPNYTWRGQPQPVPSDGAIKARATEDGDKVKVFVPGFTYTADSLPFKFATPSTPVPPTGSVALDKVNTFLAGLHGGDNIERNAAWELSTAEHVYIHEQVPMDAVRVFFSWRPQGGFGPNQAGQLASADAVRAFVGGIKKIQQAGYKRCFADCTDVLDEWEGLKVGNAEELCRQNIRMVCEEVKAQQISPDFLCIGPVNEWATSQDVVHRLQDDFLGIMRGILPQHILSSGCDYWKYWGMLIQDQNYKPPKDELTIIDTHSYKEMDEAGWKWLAGELGKWQERTKRRVVFGEAGCGNMNGQETDETAWQRNMRLMLPIMRPYVPMTWTICFGGHWRHNEVDPRSKIKPAIATALRDGLGV